MKASEVKVGGKYLAKVNNRIVTVRVDAIRPGYGSMPSVMLGSRAAKTTFYDVTNLSTGRKTTFRSAAKFRSEVLATGGSHICPFVEPTSETDAGASTTSPSPTEGEQSHPPTASESTPAPSADTTGATVPARTSDQTEEDEQSQDPLESGAAVTTPSVHTATAPASTPLSSLAGRIATTNQKRQRGEPVAGMVPNEEQEAIIEAAMELQAKGQGGVLVVGAGAGTGKTASERILEQILRGRGQYTAFNTAIVTESKAKFTKCAVNTTHSLAFRAVGRAYAHRLNGERMRSREVAQRLGIQPFTITLKGMGAPDEAGKPTDKVKVLQPEYLAGQVLVAIRRFCQSADRELCKDHFNYIEGADAPCEDGKRGRENNEIVREYLLPFAIKMWQDISKVDGQLPFNHDCYVKLWQLGEGDDRPIIAADYILLDEAQDTAPVFLDILKQQRHALLVLVGDDNQQIYEWRGAVNAMASFPGAPRRLLSQSYRFGQAVADVANTVLAELDEPTDLVMRGNPSLPSRVGLVAEPRCYLYRTNAGAISRVMMGIAEGKKPHLIFGSEDAKRGLISFFNGVLELQAKPPRKTTNAELACFDSWDEVVEYSQSDEGQELRLMVKLVNEFGAAEIRDALKNMPKEEDADFVCSTAHRSKGREWDTVKLGPDFPLANKMSDSDRRLLYVAATRAKLTLDISECPPFCGGNDSYGGEDGGGRSERWVPGLTIRYTKPMPSLEEQDDWLDARKYDGAKKASAEAKAPTAEQVKQMFEAKDRAEAAREIAQAKQEAAKQARVENGCTWYRFRDVWCVRGRPGLEVGARVCVTRRDGSSQNVTIKSVVHKFSDAWIYAS